MKCKESEKYYPKHAHKTKREWLKDVRKRWVKFRKKFRGYPDSVFVGSAYYPDYVYDWLKKFEYVDKLMKDYYKHS